MSDFTESVEDRILKQSSDLFRKNGIKSVTMDEVALRLGMSKRTLYEKFPNKDELLKACLRKELSQQTTDIFDSGKSIIELMFDFYVYAKKYAHLINRNYYRDMKRYYPQVYAILEEHQKKKGNASIVFINKGKELGEIRPEVNAEISALLFKVQFDLLWLSDELNNDQYSVGEVLSEIIINFIRGISTNKGLELLDKLMKQESF